MSDTEQTTEAAPVVISKRELISHLEAMARCVDMDDSFDGTITYSAAPEKDTFEVQCFYRVGNRSGQGGSYILRQR